MPSHTGGNDRSYNGTFVNQKKITKAGNDNKRDINQQNLERDARRERRAVLSEKSQLEHLTYKKHVEGGDVDPGTAPAKVIKNH